MSVHNPIFLALDTSSDVGVVALFDRDNIYFSQTLPQKLTHGQLLCSAIENGLATMKEDGLELAGIFVGLGPGSFVGLRVALATALGFSFGRSLPLMGFCSHLALANSLSKDTRPISIAMKASGDLCYLTSFGANAGLCEVVPKQQIWTKLASDSRLLSNLNFDQNNDAQDIIVVKCDGPTACGVQKAALQRLSHVGRIIDESDYIKPNYVKGANVSVAKRQF